MSMSKKGPAVAVCVGRSVLIAVACVALAFSTPTAGAAEAPLVGKGDATAIGDTSALVRFKVVAGEGKDLSVVVCYGKEDGETTEDAWKARGEAQLDKTAGPEDYTVRLEELEPDTRYFYRIRATTTAGTTWSNVAELRTLPPATPWYIGLAILLGVLAVIILPFLGGAWLADRLRMPDHGWKLGLVLSSLVCGIAVTYFGWPPSLGIDLKGGVVLVYELEEPTGAEAKKAAAEKKEAKAGTDEEEADDQEAGEKQVDMDKLIGAITLRVNPGGTREVTIRKYGPRQIEIIIPGAADEEVRRIESKVSQAGTLEFRILANNRDHKTEIALAQATEANEVVDAQGELVAWWVSVTEGQEDSFATYTEIATRVANDRGKQRMQILVVNDPFNIKGEYLQNCTSGNDQHGRPCVNFTFNTVGGQRFGGLTGANTPDKVQQDFTRKLGIILDGYLYSAPAIQSTIYERGEITGSFTEQEVSDLVDVLNAGSLPAALKKEPISKLLIGPTLGADTIRRGSIAIAISMVMVLVFMAVYYRFAGIVACGALLINLVLILAVMIAIHADFTLPGIAGLVLTVGMAVDANVLIYERIREELARDAALRMALRNGFARATTTIVDANVTTLITALVLYVVGTPQIKGFAVILILGVLLSMYTAIFCSRVVFDIAERRRWITSLNMRQMIRNTKVDFVGLRRAGYAFSLTLIVIGLVSVFFRGKGLLDIDFTGGESVEVLFDQPQAIADVREKLADLPDLAVSDVRIENETPGLRFVINTSKEVPEGQSATDAVEDYIHEVFGNKLDRNLLTISDVKPIEGPAAQPTEPEPTEPEPTEPEPTKPEPAKAEPAKPEPAKPEPAKPEPAKPEPAKAEPAKAEPVKPEPAKAEPAKAEPGSQSRAERPSSTLLASSDPSAVLLVQAAPAEKTEAKPAEEPKAEPAPAQKAPESAEAKPPEKAPEPPKKEVAPAEKTPEKAEAKAAAETEAKPPVEKAPESTPPPPSKPVERFAGGTRAALTFKHEVDHDTLNDMIVARLKAAKVPTVPFALSNEKYIPGDTAAYHDWVLEIKLPTAEVQEKLLGPLQAELDQTPYFPSSSSIGGKVAGDMQEKAVLALLGSLICIIAYIWIRFQRVMYGVAAVVALVHDVLITLGALAISAYLAPFLGILLIDPFKISLAVLAAFLTIIGYSLNDTIIVFDRIREVRGKSPHVTGDMINTSINQTLSRTLITSLTTLIVIVILYIAGGQGIHAFAFSLLVGVLIGTYSSIFIASPILLWMTRSVKPTQSSSRS